MNKIALALLFLSTSALANIPDLTTNGTTISWSGSGWIQVQSATSYQTVCEGRINTCETDGGTFNVINHSTSARSNNVVAIASAPAPAPVARTSAPEVYYVHEDCTYVSRTGNPLPDVIDCGCDCEPGDYLVGITSCEVRGSVEGLIPEVTSQAWNGHGGCMVEVPDADALNAVDGWGRVQVYAGIACLKP